MSRMCPELHPRIAVIVTREILPALGSLVMLSQVPEFVAATVLARGMIAC